MELWVAEITLLKVSEKHFSVPEQPWRKEKDTSSSKGLPDPILSKLHSFFFPPWNSDCQGMNRHGNFQDKRTPRDHPSTEQLEGKSLTPFAQAFQA